MTETLYTGGSQNPSVQPVAVDFDARCRSFCLFVLLGNRWFKPFAVYHLPCADLGGGTAVGSEPAFILYSGGFRQTMGIEHHYQYIPPIRHLFQDRRDARNRHL